MSAIVSGRMAPGLPANGEKPRMAKASLLPKGENVEFRGELRRLGECLNSARNHLGWTVDRLARELKRDEKQVARWMRGEERTQVDVVFSVAELRQPFVIALAGWAECQIEVVIRARTA